MYARQKLNSEYGTNILAQSTVPTDLGGRTRATDTFKSNFNFTPITSTKKEDMSQRQVRDRQFQGNVVQPPATRQSYQDSDIFGTKGYNETVQKSAHDQKSLKERFSNTFKSTTFRVEESAQANTTRDRNQVTRQNERWESNVFATPQLDQSRRKNLEKKGAGYGGLYGDSTHDKWDKKLNFAGEVSQREKTRPPVLEGSAADERKLKELYGNSKYEPLKREFWKNQKEMMLPQRPQTQANPQIKETLSRKANELQSHVLTHDDDTLRNERLNSYQNNPRINGASNSGWNAQTAFAKPNNTTQVNAYKMRQNQLNSQVLEATDYSHLAPNSKKQIDPNNVEAAPPSRSPKKKTLTQDLSYANGNWTQTDVKGQIKKDYTNYDRKQMVHAQQASTLDGHNFTNAPHQEQAVDDYQLKHSSNVPAKTMGASIKQKNLASNFAGHDALKYYGQHGESSAQSIIDIDLSGLPQFCDEATLKKVADVKHVISMEIPYDNLKGVCKGEGRIKIRLNKGESLEQIRLNFLRAGYVVKNHQEDPRKRPVITGPKKDVGEHRFYNAKDKKTHEMATKFESKAVA